MKCQKASRKAMVIVDHIHGVDETAAVSILRYGLVVTKGKTTRLLSQMFPTFQAVGAEAMRQRRLNRRAIVDVVQFGIVLPSNIKLAGCCVHHRKATCTG